MLTHELNKMQGDLSEVLLIVLLSFSFMVVGCEDNTVDSTLRSPRSYDWTVDTLAYPGGLQTVMTSIWGDNISDVWTVGHTEGGGGKMWRFDGTRWTDYKLQAVQGGPIAGVISLSAVFGFSKGDVYVIGSRGHEIPISPPSAFTRVDSTLLIHFNGQAWQDVTMSKVGHLTSIGGGDASSFWLAGLNKYIYKRENFIWKMDSLPVHITEGGQFQVNSVAGNSSSDIFMLGNTHVNSTATTRYYFFQRRSQQWVVVDSFDVMPGQSGVRWGVNDLWLSPSGVLYSCGDGVFTWTGGSWMKVAPHPGVLIRMTGTKDNDIVAVGSNGTILHFNESDWQPLSQFQGPGKVFWDVWKNSQGAFVVGFTTGSFPQKSFVLRGN